MRKKKKHSNFKIQLGDLSPEEKHALERVRNDETLKENLNKLLGQYLKMYLNDVVPIHQKGLRKRKIELKRGGGAKR